ncbi:hypothetical protein CCACVL1_15391 [Corchorus capsularis]|uniref:Uncharacterized protein n=1 Tax=Corchorus capsularis TaxID=210143 RepID=A0A1R3I2Q1_COCAP|nr:hypothetical protein CCACVL1_15391 [Corchorus capsularis]
MGWALCHKIGPPKTEMSFTNRIRRAVVDFATKHLMKLHPSLSAIYIVMIPSSLLVIISAAAAMLIRREEVATFLNRWISDQIFQNGIIILMIFSSATDLVHTFWIFSSTFVLVLLAVMLLDKHIRRKIQAMNRILYLLTARGLYFAVQGQYFCCVALISLVSLWILVGRLRFQVYEDDVKITN